MVGGEKPDRTGFWLMVEGPSTSINVGGFESFIYYINSKDRFDGNISFQILQNCSRKEMAWGMYGWTHTLGLITSTNVF